MKKLIIFLAAIFVLGVAGIVIILTLVPLIYPKALPKAVLAQLLVAPPPPPPPESLTEDNGAKSHVIPNIHVAEAIMQSQLLKRTPALQPGDVKFTGEVVLTAVINEKGIVESANVISGHPMLQQAALESVQHWKYRPYALNGKPVKVHTTIRVTVPSK